MKGRSALPRRAFIVVLAVVLVGAIGAIWGRGLLERAPAFKVRQIEVIGTDLLAPDSVLGIALIDREKSVWQDFTPAAVQLTGHPLIAEAQVYRVGLRTVRIVVTEVEPIALVGVPELRAVRADGVVLPVDPSRTSLDLPILTIPAEVDTATSALKDGPARSALAVLSAIHEVDPALAALISDLGLRGSNVTASFVASVPARQIVLPGQVDKTLVARIRATLADLRSRGIEASSIEARYANQIVVRLAQSSREAGTQT